MKKKVQLKTLIDADIHKKLVELCEKTRRKPSGMVEFLTAREWEATGHRHDQR